ncbi:MAG: hypothetical protein L0Z50_42535, partial [Verrucomicrobiales bacterium]|nr:hypothetical protein [Verrucomicrobiales bacterium]
MRDSTHLSIKLSAFTLIFLALSFQASAQFLPLEIPQDATRYNLQSTNGVPISSTRGQPPGSDGRAPTAQQQQAAGLTTAPATAMQFQNLLSFGALAAPRSSNLVANLSLAENAENLDLPRGPGNAVVMVSARVGAVFFSRRLSFLFGAVIPPPDTDEYGVALNMVNTNVSPQRPVQLPEEYWLAEPHSTTGHTNAGYYWSAHAQSVFAIQPGPLGIAWRTLLPASSSNLPVNVGSITLAGMSYRVYTNRYIISGSPAKPPRKIYWTEGPFRATGKPVNVPSARVGAVHIVYNNNFPERVTEEVRVPGHSHIVTSNRLEELRTLWYDQSLGQILAYNVEGRTFLELLGDSRPNQTREHLGFEIVDVIRQPNPADVIIELGEQVSAYPGGDPDDSHLFPEPILNLQQSFAFQHNINGSARVQFFATRETRNLNDFQVHWLEAGVEGLRWPFRLVRYKFVWPDDVTRYSHYIRPLVATEEEAKATAVVLPTENAPIIDYQDPLDQERGKLTEKFEYFSFLTPAYPVHRALLRLTSGEYVRFERVFSWLDDTLKSQNFAGTLATNLITWDAAAGQFNWPPGLAAPRLVNVTVNVGDRITAPPGEIGASPSTNYLAGHIVQAYGDSFNPNTYVDPFAGGFDAANRGAIIPVNAIPARNQLEVWWFRRNAVDLTQGFKTILWPSVIGRYTLQWPAEAVEIVLASNDGSGPLPSLQAKGRIYVQNDATQPGYNPNEEHALMQGGQAFALRDDLNITNSVGYSSHPFVLLEYTEADERPAIRAFRVLREKPEEGIVFDYSVAAGTILQPPMPLPLLEKPLAPAVAGEPPISLNTELEARTVANSSVSVDTNGVSAWELTTTTRHYFPGWRELVVQDASQPANAPTWLYPTNVGGTTLSGFASIRRPYYIKDCLCEQTGGATRWRYAINTTVSLPLNTTVVLVDPATESTWIA